MKFVRKSLVLFLTSMACCDVSLFAQAPAATSNSSVPVAVIDVGHIFKNHARFKQQMDGMKGEVENFEKEVNEERKTLLKQRDKLQTFNAGSPEYKQLEEEIARQVSDQQVRGTLKRKDVMEREAKIYYETYNEIVREIGKTADTYGISLVLRYEGEPIDARDRNSILAGVNRPIVYQRNLDLTQLVLKQLNQGQPIQQQAIRPNVGGSTGPSSLRPR